MGFLGLGFVIFCKNSLDFPHSLLETRISDKRHFENTWAVKFSNDLVQEAIDYFLEEHGEVIDEETAQEYLNAFADLYESFMAFASYDL